VQKSIIIITIFFKDVTREFKIIIEYRHAGIDRGIEFALEKGLRGDQNNGRLIKCAE